MSFLHNKLRIHMIEPVANLVHDYIISASETIAIARSLPWKKNDLIWMFGCARLPNILDYRESDANAYRQVLAAYFGSALAEVHKIDEFRSLCERISAS